MWFQKPPLGTPLNFEHPMNKDLALHLAMNEGHGDVVRDLSLYGNHGTLKNMAFPSTPASGWNPGQTGVGLNWDGGDDYIDCGNDASLDITDAITISSWVYPTADKTYARIVDKNYATGYALWGHNIVTNKTFTFASQNAGVSKVSYNVFESNEWQLLTVTYDRANVKFYRNAVYAGGGVETAALGTNNTALCIGAVIGAGNPFAGSLDQVRIHNRTWTAKEVKDYVMNPWQVYLQ